MTAICRFMSWFWWRFACPQPDGRFNCLLRGKPYAWTARLHVPWYLLTHPKERFRVKRFPWWRLVPSVLLMPLGVAMALAGRRWRKAAKSGSVKGDRDGR